MLDHLLRDEHLVPSVARNFAALRAYFQAARDVVRPKDADEVTTAAIGHALSFRTWQSLVREQALAEREAVQLMCRLVAAARAGAASR